MLGMAACELADVGMSGICIRHMTAYGAVLWDTSIALVSASN